jgi:hypothetical protein
MVLRSLILCMSVLEGRGLLLLHLDRKRPASANAATVQDSIIGCFQTSLTAAKGLFDGLCFHGASILECNMYPVQGVPVGTRLPTTKVAFKVFLATYGFVFSLLSF